MESDSSSKLNALIQKYPTKESILRYYFKYSQEHVFNHVDELQSDQVDKFFDSIKDFDLEMMKNLYESMVCNPSTEITTNEEITKPENILRTKDLSSELQSKMTKTGLDMISEGKIAVLLMSGGQGTRLGFEHAKGLYNIGMPSNMTIFEYHAYRIKRMSEIISERKGVQYTKSLIRWYIMTSDMNNEEITAYFKENNYFGLGEDTIRFFAQESLPALDLKGKVIMEDKNFVCQAPNGNGGVFAGLVKHGLVNEMRDLGIKYLQIVGVDNVLVKPGDPLFIGYAETNNFEIACKFIPKGFPEEKVGIFVLRNGKPYVIEYIEMTEEMVHRKDEQGNLFFDLANIVNALYSVEFLEVAAYSSAKNFHLAKKKIKYYDETQQQVVNPKDINGYKFELFYFDVFPLSTAKKFGLIESKREDEFAPVKNAPGTTQDSPDTARTLMSKLHQSWAESKGVKFNSKASGEKDQLCEIDVRLVYDQTDPNLEKLTKKYDKEVKLPAFLE